MTAISYIIQEAEKIAINNMPVFETNVITGIVLLAVFIFIDRFIMLGYMPLFSVMRYRVVSNVNVLIVEKTSRLPYSYIESADFQNKLQAVRNFANNLPDLFDISLSSLRSIITIIALLLKFKQRFYLFFIIALASLPSLIFSSRLKKEEHEMEIKLAGDQRVENYYLDLLHKFPYVKEKHTFQLKNLFADRWNKTTDKINQARLDFELKSARLDIVGGVFHILAYLVPLILILLSPSVTAGEFIALSTAILSIQNAFQSLIPDIINLKGQIMNDTVVYDFLNSQEENLLFPYVLEGPIKEISFDNVSFTYPGSEKKALDDITVSLSKGETIVIIGENGAGKSTFLKLILGLYNPQEGSVTCNDFPTYALERESYFRRISVILQDYNKYPLTIAQNIDLFAEENEPPTEGVISAARASDIHNWILSLRDGYNTLLTYLRPNGRELSGGQWQKIAIARGLLKNADLFIMDEPTSSLDPLMEAEILNQFIELSPGALKIIVTHRVGIASKADRILVFDAGKLVEMGKHEELLRRNGVYTNLYNIQKKWYSKKQSGDEVVL